MINITKFFRENFDETEYYGYSFPYLAISEDIPEYSYYDDKELISEFKKLIDPVNEKKLDLKMQDKFILMCFYFNKNGYYIEQFPNLFERPDKEKCFPDFMINKIRNYIMMKRNDFNSIVKWDERRRLINNLEFIKRKYFDVDIDQVVNIIKTNDKEFSQMSLDDKLLNICNAIEYLLKDNSGKYIEIDFNGISEIISNDDITKYKNKLQCFRHASKESIAERNSYSNNDKEILINYGIFVIKAIVNYK